MVFGVGHKQLPLGNRNDTNRQRKAPPETETGATENVELPS